ncbi:hypothetical protein [Teredinibacter turnerae]|uniref:Uncharacterized protein n=1 Tax=Teredinibacter turnerae (strain ATCC 39867 / T7901) TaxID=377629 RepID=C5BTF5_TERTT|nr:hypothetical protein [Teredinibacter turnerae]ACR14419.1 conserved hypothetical protein [Teredinibacter turnerae T7901]
MSDLITERLQRDWPVVCEIWQALRGALDAVGLQDKLPAEPAAFTRTELKKDPFDSSESLSGEWLVNGQLIGSVIVHENGQAYAEYDVVQPHPSKPQWFIEATTAWGKSGALASELRLLPAL